MTDKAQLKRDCKKNIHGLVLSAPVGLTIRELMKDYMTFIGTPIPFRELGYNTLDDFLSDIPDTVSVGYEKGVMVLRGNADSTTKHIEKLVSRQKIPNKKKWAVLRKPPPRRNFHRPAPVVQNHVRNQIQELFKAYKDGVPLTHFESCFSRRFGLSLDYKAQNFNTLKDLLGSIPSVVKLQTFQNGEVRVVPSRRPQSSRSYQSNNERSFNQTDRPQRNIQPQNVPETIAPHQTVASTNVQSHNVRQQDKPQQNVPSQHVSPQTAPTRLIQTGNMLYQVPVSSKIYVPSSSVQYLPPQSSSGASASSHALRQPETEHLSTREQTHLTSPEEDRYQSYLSEELKKKETDARQRHVSEYSVQSSSGHSFDSGDLMFDDDCGIPRELQEQIRQVLEGREEGLKASLLLYEYKKKFGKELSFREQGFHSVVELVSTLPKDVVTIERPHKKGDWLLFDTSIRRHHQVAENAAQVASKGSANKGTNSFKESVRQVLQLHPAGILMQNFPEKYKEMTGKSLDEEISYCGSLEKLCVSLTDDVLQINYKGDGCLMLHAIYSEVSRKFDKLLETYQPHSTSAQPIEDNRLPGDVVGPGTYYSHINLTNNDDYIEIYVSNIVNPGVFWIQFREKNHTIALERLMDDLEFYKNSSGDPYRLPPSLLAVGQVVAVIFPEDDNWHRGIITGIRTIDFVDVYYVDYGNTCSVHKKNLRLLRSRFLKLPAQAVQARLANIQPVKENWTVESKMEMLKICTQKPLIALVTGQRNRVLSICLTDTNSEDDLHVNDHLVSEGYAVFAPDELQTSSVYPEGMLEIPDEALIYGASKLATDIEEGGMAVGGRQESQDGAVGYDGGHRSIQIVELCGDVCVHMISWEREAWLVSAEMSALLWEDDILRSMLQTKRLLVKKHVLSRSEQPALFQELLYYGVRSVTEDKMYITIYPLNRLPEILRLFQHPDPSLAARVEEILRDFDPDDLYWKGEDDAEMAADIQRELEETQLGVDELKLTLQALVFKRKRILQSMLSDGGGSSQTDYVNQLHEVEVQISTTKELMEEVEETLRMDDADNHQQQQANEAASPSQTLTSSTTVKTNRVAPLVNAVSPQKRVESMSSSMTSLASSGTAPPSTSTPGQMTQEQLMSLMSQSMAAYNMMPMMAAGNMQMPSLGRGQPMGQQKAESVMPGLQQLMLSGLNPSNTAMPSGGSTLNAMSSGISSESSSNQNFSNVMNPPLAAGSSQMNTNMNQAMQVMNQLATLQAYNQNTNMHNFPQPNMTNSQMSTMTTPNFQAMMGMPGLQGLMTGSNPQMPAAMGNPRIPNNPQANLPMPNIAPNPRLQMPQAMQNVPNMANLQAMQSMQNMGAYPNMQGMFNVASTGVSGNEGNPASMGLLPELLPLLNNLNMGNTKQSK